MWSEVEFYFDDDFRVLEVVSIDALSEEAAFFDGMELTLEFGLEYPREVALFFVVDGRLAALFFLARQAMLRLVYLMAYLMRWLVCLMRWLVYWVYLVVFFSGARWLWWYFGGYLGL